MDEHREPCLQLEEALKEALNAVVSQTEENIVLEKLKAKLARSRKVWIRKWFKRTPIHDASYKLFKNWILQRRCNINLDTKIKIKNIKKLKIRQRYETNVAIGRPLAKKI